jgi:hypothetical protein
MFEATVEKPTNLLKVSYAGRIDAKEASRCAEAIHSLLSQLQKGFSLLSDLRALETMELECIPYIEKVMDWCNEAGVSKVVRIIPDSHKDIGFNIMSLFHYRRGVRIVTCQTLEDAQRALGS